MRIRKRRVFAGSRWIDGAVGVLGSPLLSSLEETMETYRGFSQFPHESKEEGVMRWLNDMLEVAA